MHCAVISGDIETIKHIHSVYPESEREQAVRMQDHEGYTVWRHATQSRDPETIEYILAVMPESERLQILNMKDKNGRTALHCAVTWRGKPIECIKVILAFHPESQRLHVLNSQDQSGKTVLHYAAELNDVFDKEMPLLESLLAGMKLQATLDAPTELVVATQQETISAGDVSSALTITLVGEPASKKQQYSITINT